MFCRKIRSSLIDINAYLAKLYKKINLLVGANIISAEIFTLFYFTEFQESISRTIICMCSK